MESESRTDRVLRGLHRMMGIVGVLVFLGTGGYMRANFPDLYADAPVSRYLYRANHVYILMGALINLAIGIHFRMQPGGWRAKLQLVGSVLVLLAPIALVAAFFQEAPIVTPERGLTALGVFSTAIGVVLHWPGRRRSTDPR